jgi:hypothetical protein
MTSHLRELTSIAKDLPDDKAEELVDFARFLRQKVKATAKSKKKRASKVDGDKEWERILNDPRPSPKFQKFLEKARTGKSSPMDYDRL